MRPLDWMFLLGAAGQLTLAGLCFVRGKKSPVARPLMFLCLSIFGWCFTSLAFGLAEAGPGGAGVVKTIGDLDTAVSALSPPFALHLVVTFVGARKAYIRAVILEYVFFAALSVSSAAAVAVPAMRSWNDSTAWAVTFLVGVGSCPGPHPPPARATPRLIRRRGREGPDAHDARRAHRGRCPRNQRRRARPRLSSPSRRADRCPRERHFGCERRVSLSPLRP